MKPVIRASSAARLLGCSGSPTLEARYFREVVELDDTPNPMVWLGNWCHHMAATHLVDHHAAIGTLPDIGVPPGYQPPKFAQALVGWYLGNLLVLTPSDHQIQIERFLRWEFDRFILEGHPDVSTYGLEDFCINDLKAGFSEVEPAETNWQLAIYATLLHKHAPEYVRGKLRIFQRSAPFPISEAEIDDLPLVAEVIEEKINEALDNPYRIETGTHCNFCAAKRFCPAVRGDIDEHMKMLLKPEDVERLKVLPDLKELGGIVRNARITAARITDLSDSFRERLAQQGGQLTLADGTVAKIVEEPGRRSFKNHKAAFELAQTKLTAEELWDSCVEISVTGLEDALVAKGMKRTSKKEESASGFVNKSMDHLLDRPTVQKLKFA